MEERRDCRGSPSFFFCPQSGSKLDTGRWAYNAQMVTNRLKDTAKSSALIFGLADIPADVVSMRQQLMDMQHKQKVDALMTAYEKNVGEALTSEGDYDSLQSLKEDADVITIGKSVGAKAKNYEVELPNKEIVYLSEGTRVTHVEVIAGKGRKREIDEIDGLLVNFPGTSAREWQKKKGLGYVDYEGESYMAELHWYEEPTVGRVKWKVKPDKDGNWFYDD